jgi:signal transduction histidine kinase
MDAPAAAPPPTSLPDETLEVFQQKAFARYVLFDMPYPVAGAALLMLLLAWLMHGKVGNGAITAWLLLGTVTVAARELFVRRMKVHVSQGHGHATALHGIALFSVPLGALSGAFAWMYFDAQQPMTMVILGTYMTVVIVSAILATSVHPPSFYLLALAAHPPYLLRLLLSEGQEHLVLAGINALFLLVTFGYARAANMQHRETMRLRFENQNLIHDLELRNTAVEHASRDKSLFLAGISHDLKQPIRAISMYSGYLRHAAAQDIGPQQVLQTAEKIDQAVGAIHGQIRRLLELSELESGAMPVHLTCLQLDEVLQAQQALLAPDAKAKGVRLHLAALGQREVWADRRMLDSVLHNLIGNAIQHAKGSCVYVGERLRTTFPPGQQLCIEVRDNGVGIPAHRLPLLFDAYRSFDDRQASDSHGLGLAIAKAQASYLGCEIDVRSQPGRGSTFTLCGLRTTPPVAPESEPTNTQA